MAVNVLRQAAVYVRDEFVGVVQETDDGYSFVYDADYMHSEKPKAVLNSPCSSCGNP